MPLELIKIHDKGRGMVSFQKVSMFPLTYPYLTAAWLAQLVERQSVVREVEGSGPRPDQHSGS